MSKDVFVLGLDEMNREALQSLPGLAGYRFHPLLDVETLQRKDPVPIPELLDNAENTLRSFDGSVDAIVGFWDFPVSSMVPILCARLGLPSAPLEAAVKCEHKYWSRLEQQKVIDEHPRFGLVEFDAQVPPEGLDYPMWLKPVKSFSSELAFRVGSDAQFREALAEIREGVGRVGGPFEFVLEQLDLPREVEEAGGQACLAEEAVSGIQATVEGYIHKGEAYAYGVLDSPTYPGTSSFLRYQYPSALPETITQRMIDVSKRVVRQVGLDEVTFNVEFFWNSENEALYLLEVNPRHSQSHAKLFEAVDGVANHECMVRLALGQTPQLPYREGEFPVAAKWFLRRFEDGVVRRVPTPEETARVEREVPGTSVKIVVHEGERLSEMLSQDSYSYEIAQIFIGARDDTELCDKYEQCAAALPFEFADVDG